ncbi:hypothetical protein C0992_005687 [Termitomyces sp. T32_za158]|nr:hypothetical protein C0992_005687 [Termitomyces sp. T32_za158]
MRKLASHRVLHIHAPPGTGKSVMAKQIGRYEALFHEVTQTTLSAYDYEFARQLIKQEGKPQQKVPEWYTAFEAANNNDRQSRLIILGKTNPFWSSIKAFQVSSGRVYVILCGACGEGPSAAASSSYNRGAVTPIDITPIDYTALLLTPDELATLYMRYNESNRGIPLDEKATKYINAYLGGHAGLTVYLLVWLQRNKPEHFNLAKEPWVSDPVKRSNECLLYIANSGISTLRTFRTWSSLGSLHDFKEEAKARQILELMVLSPHGTLDRKDAPADWSDAITELVRKYFISSTMKGWAFVSKFVQYQLLASGRHDSSSLDATSPLDFHAMVLRTLQNMRLRSLQRSISHGQDALLLEAALQHEFHAATTSVLRRGEQCDPEVGGCFDSAGRIAFWFLPSDCGVELLRNGSSA